MADSRSTSQDWLVEKMNAAGYPVDACCYGYAHAAMHAIVTGDLDRFRERIQTIHDIDAKQLTENIRLTREIVKYKTNPKHTQINEEMIIDSYCKENKIQLNKGDAQYTHLKNKVNELYNSEDQRIKWLEILAFFEIIKCYQDTDFYNFLIPAQMKQDAQDANSRLALLQPTSVAIVNGTS